MSNPAYTPAEMQPFYKRRPFPARPDLAVGFEAGLMRILITAYTELFRI